MIGLSMLTMMAIGGQIVLQSTLRANQLLPPGSPTPISKLILSYYEGAALWIILLSVFVGSGLISRDLQTGSLRLYLSRPITRLDYYLGKFSVLGVFIGLITFVPGLLLLLLHAVTSEDFSVFGGRALDLILAVSVGYVLVACSITLALSALTESPRIAGVSCLGVWFLGTLIAEFLHRAYRGAWPQLFSPIRVVQSIGERIILAEGASSQQTWETPLEYSSSLMVIGALVLLSIVLVWYRLSQVRR